MGARLKATIQRWKNNALEGTKRHRLTQARLKRSQRRVKKLEAELEQMKALTCPLAIEGHVYPAQLIALAVFIVVQAKGSLRCAAKTVGFVARLLSWDYAEPSHTSVRRWVLRSGLYQLQHASDKAGDYVAILDESIQIGREKLLLMLGVKIQGDRSHCAPLTGAEVEVLGLEVQQSWKGEEVAGFIRRNLDRLPQVNISYFITDGGTNLAKALKILAFSAVNDCTHMMMNAVKKLLQDDKTLSTLAADIGQLRRKLILSAEGYLLPPTLRDKDRFLRIFTIVHWVERIDSYWAKLPQSSRNKLSFIKRARSRVQCMEQLKALVELTARVLKYAGLSSLSQAQWEQHIASYSAANELSAEAQAFIETIRQYFAKHADLVGKHQRLLCCSDIIESTFGRYKNKGGTPVISADVLGIPLYHTRITPQFIQKALATVPYKAVQYWEKHYTCDNRYSIVRRMNSELKTVA